MKSLNVLIAEDSLLNQKFAMRILEQEGHTVFVAANGREALKAIEHEDFDLVLMDVEMPEMNGLEATQAIRSAEKRGTHLPIVAVTATGNRQDCLDAGMDDWLAKPLSLTQLNAKIERILPPTAA